MRSFSIAERAAIGELLEIIAVLVESHGNRPNAQVAAIAALASEVVANIIRGERGPRLATADDIRIFARSWGIDERAAFNPPERS